MGESWAKCIAKITEIEGGDLDAEEKNSKIEQLLENQASKIKPLLSFLVLECEIPKEESVGNESVILEASLYNWGVHASNYIANSSYAAESASLARHGCEYLFVQAKLAIFRIYLSVVAALDNVGLCKRLSRRSGIKDAHDFHHVMKVKELVDTEALSLAFISDKLMLADYVNKRTTRNGEKAQAFRGLKRGFLKAYAKGDKKGSNLMQVIGKKYTWERF